MKVEELGVLSRANELLDHLEHKNVTKVELCRALTLNTFRTMEAVACYIAELNNDGTVRVDTTYGLSDYESSQWKNLSLFDHRPLTNAIRNNEPVWTDLAGGGLSDYPIISAEEYINISQSQVVWPITRARIPIGAIGLFFNKSINVSEVALQYLELIGRIVALKLITPFPFAPNPQDFDKFVHHHDQLTERESKVLERIGQYMTNAQIAEELGFSESTIRQDTIQIYRKMGVAGRDEARKRFLNNQVS